ncbi:MAG: hypothetical protein GC160_16875 [Acidobacteria bacterium]|nr:hypothetical protein [Acidobacteriota bacterium]
MSKRFALARSRIRRPEEILEQTADEVRARLLQRHLPHGTILDPIFEAPDSEVVAAYSRGGDSAIWTGHFLAAETYRFVATGSADAWYAIIRCIGEMRKLVDVTGTNLLARGWLPADSPWAASVAVEEEGNGIYSAMLDGAPAVWIGNTSRDQYLGFLFGLSVAFEWIYDEGIRADIRDLVTRTIEFLLDKDWAVRMPDGSISTVFWHRVDQRLAILQVGRQVNDARFSKPYRNERLLGSAQTIPVIGLEVLDDHSSYFKFNLIAIAMFSLIRSELSDTHRGRYMTAYKVYRRTVDDHGNAHFNMIDRVLQGPDERRDAETVELLLAWVRRPSRDFSIDWRGVVPECGEDRACDPLPVEDRVRTDFVWQRSPFQLHGGGDGYIETAGVDFLLPYWMARVYRII